MIDCCELALHNGKLALYIALGAFAVISFLLAMFFGYNLKLGWRTTKLEKKNGGETKQIKDLQERVDFLEEKLIEKYSKRKVEDMTMR
jgi:hypothetical protein